MDQCGFKQQMIIKLCAALAMSKHTAILRSLIVDLYPGPATEVRPPKRVHLSNTAHLEFSPTQPALLRV
eukprot:6475688-Prymnesium_polylepis.1